MNPAAVFFRNCRQRQSSPAHRATRGLRQQASRTFSFVPYRLADMSSFQETPLPRAASIALKSSSPSNEFNASITGDGIATLPRSNLDKAGTKSEQQTARVIGTVTRAGTMKQTVAVRTNKQIFDKFLQKHYNKGMTRLVHDPDDVLVEGDVVAYSPFSATEWEERVRRGKNNVKHVLSHVITPFGRPLDQRIPKVTIQSTSRLASKKGSPTKQHRAAGVRGYATMVVAQEERRTPANLADQISQGHRPGRSDASQLPAKDHTALEASTQPPLAFD